MRRRDLLASTTALLFPFAAAIEAQRPRPAPAKAAPREDNQFAVNNGVYAFHRNEAGKVYKIKDSPLIERLEQNVTGYDFTKRTVTVASYIGNRPAEEKPLDGPLHPVLLAHARDTLAAGLKHIETLESRGALRPIYQRHKEALTAADAVLNPRRAFAPEGNDFHAV